MAVTLQQIAEAAGVSRGTVDRALNNRGRIRPEVEERIKRIAREMGYQPSRAGRALAMAKRKIRIGVILRTPQAQVVDAKPTQLVLFQDLQTSRQVTVKLSSSEQRYGYQVFDWVIPLRNMKSTPK